MTAQSPDIKLGDRIEAIGFPAPRDSGPILQDAVLRDIAPGQQLRPTPATSAELSSGSFNYSLVSTEGRLLRRMQEPFREVLLLQDNSALLLQLGQARDLQGWEPAHLRIPACGQGWSNPKRSPDCLCRTTPARCPKLAAQNVRRIVPQVVLDRAEIDQNGQAWGRSTELMVCSLDPGVNGSHALDADTVSVHADQGVYDGEKGYAGQRNQRPKPALAACECLIFAVSCDAGSEVGRPRKNPWA